MRGRHFAILLVIGVLVLFIQLLYLKISTPLSQDEPFEEAEQGDADLSLRVNGFPSTHIAVVHVSLTGPEHSVRIEWSGPNAANLERGPFRSSPGIGVGGDCNDYNESRRTDSNCTPKGEWKVAGFNDYLSNVPFCHYVTWFHLPREIALHGHPEVPPYAASHGCVRLEPRTAQLIHNNAIAGKTVVRIDGKWQPPPVNSLKRSANRDRRNGKQLALSQSIVSRRSIQ